jgi:AAA15 family ATPase/GTPase
MLKKIVLERFRGFKRLELSVPDVLILMGPNSSGKTTALHAIRIACDAAAMVVDNVSTFTIEENSVTFKDFVIRDIADLMPITDWWALFVNQQVNESIHFQIILEFDTTDPVQSITLYGKHARNDNLKVTATVESENLINTIGSTSSRTQLYKNMVFDYLKEHLPKAIFIPPFYGIIRKEEYRARAVVDTLVGSADQSHVVRNMIAQLSTEQFTQLNAFIYDMVGAQLVLRTQGDDLQKVTHLRVTFKDTNGELELSAAGAGLINLVAIYASLARWQVEAKIRQILFLLDEPEAHLHPRLQSSTADRLATIITRDFGRQLVMATHSLDIINVVGKRDDCAIFRTDRLNEKFGGEELVGQSALLDDLSDWVDITPFSAINFLASKRILFFEGKSDGEIIKKCADIYYRNNPRRKTLFDKWTLVHIDGCGNEQITGFLAKLIETSLIPNHYKPQDFKVVLQLDKDYSDTVKSFERTQHVAIETVTNVWSRHSIESLFCETVILHQWLKIKYPQISIDQIDAVISNANSNTALNQEASAQRQSALLAPLAKTTENITATNIKAIQEISQNPEIWQRGKDRASFILGEIKKSLGTDGNNMTTTLSKFIERADVNLFPAGNTSIIPSEITTLLDWMTSNA